MVHVPKKSDKIAPNRITVKCIDYGPRFNCSVFDLIKLPSKFKTLPPQVKQNRISNQVIKSGGLICF